MDALRELIPLAREAAAPRAGRALARLYVLGGALALLAALLGLLQAAGRPFAAAARRPPAPRAPAPPGKGERPEPAARARAPCRRPHAA